MHARRTDGRDGLKKTTGSHQTPPRRSGRRRSSILYCAFHWNGLTGLPNPPAAQRAPRAPRRLRLPCRPSSSKVAPPARKFPAAVSRNQMTAKMDLGAWCGVWLRITGLVGQSGGANIRPNSSHVCVCLWELGSCSGWVCSCDLLRVVSTHLRVAGLAETGICRSCHDLQLSEISHPRTRCRARFRAFVCVTASGTRASREDEDALFSNLS